MFLSYTTVCLSSLFIHSNPALSSVSCIVTPSDRRLTLHLDLLPGPNRKPSSVIQTCELSDSVCNHHLSLPSSSEHIKHFGNVFMCSLFCEIGAYVNVWLFLVGADYEAIIHGNCWVSCPYYSGGPALFSELKLQ